MTDQKNMILAIVLSIIILFAFETFFNANAERRSRSRSTGCPATDRLQQVPSTGATPGVAPSGGPGNPGNGPDQIPKRS